MASIPQVEQLRQRYPQQTPSGNLNRAYVTGISWTAAVLRQMNQLSRRSITPVTSASGSLTGRASSAARSLERIPGTKVRGTVGEPYANGLRKSLRRRATKSARRGSLQQLKRQLGTPATRRRSARLSWLRRRRSPSVSGVFGSIDPAVLWSFWGAKNPNYERSLSPIPIYEKPSSHLQQLIIAAGI